MPELQLLQQQYKLEACDCLSLCIFCFLLPIVFVPQVVVVPPINGNHVYVYDLNVHGMDHIPNAASIFTRNF